MDAVPTSREKRQCCQNGLFMYCCTTLDELMLGAVQECWVSCGMLNMENEAVCVLNVMLSQHSGHTELGDWCHLSRYCQPALFTQRLISP